MQWFSFKGINSTSLDVEAVEYVTEVRASDKSRYIVVPGRDGSVVAVDDSLNDVIVKVSCIFPVTSQESLRLTARRLATWLRGNGRLIFWDESDKFRSARIYNSPKLYDKGGWGEFEVQFRCQPLSQTIDSKTVELNTSERLDGSYYNRGTINGTVPSGVKGDRLCAGLDGEYLLTVLYNFTGGEQIMIDLEAQNVFIDDALLNSSITPGSNYFRCAPGGNTVELAVANNGVYTPIEGSYTYNACWL